MAEESRGSTAQLPWFDQGKNASFALTCTFKPKGNEAEYILSRELGGVSTNIWTHVAEDADLIINMVMMECAAGRPAEAEQAPRGFADLGELVSAELREVSKQAAPTAYKSQSSTPAPIKPARTFDFGCNAARQCERCSHRRFIADHLDEQDDRAFDRHGSRLHN